MKILSKYKDYYDYLVGIYGEDPKLILDRREYKLHSPTPRYFFKNNRRGKHIKEEVPQPFTIRIGSICIDGLYYTGRFIYGDDLSKFKISPEFCSHEEYLKSHFPEHANNKNCVLIAYWYGHSTCSMLCLQTIPYNIITDNPVAIELSWYKGIDRKSIYEFSYPILKNLDLPQIISAHNVWVELTTYISRLVTNSEPTVPIGSDNIRIESHGFDLKTSFRPKMKHL